jgi:uncharacterized protein
MPVMNKAIYVSEAKGVIEIKAPGKTDFFIDMFTMKPVDDAPFYYEKRKGDFVARVKVSPDFKKTYDAGGLFIYDTAKKWFKLEFELTDLGYPAAVSVVTDGVSDDCNGERIEGAKELWLQVARKGDNWVLYHSDDGKKWKMVRYFRLKMKETVKVGLEAQSPRGEGCKVEFSGFKIADNTLADMRKGK